MTRIPEWVDVTEDELPDPDEATFLAAKGRGHMFGELAELMGCFES